MNQSAQEKIKIGSEVGKKVNCSVCGKEGTTDLFTTHQDNKGKNVYLCPRCKDKLNSTLEEETRNPNLLLAFGVGSIGALIGGVIWYLTAIVTGMEIGYVSIGLGYLVGYGVYLGAGKKRGHQLQIMSALIAIVAIIITEKFTFDYFINDYIRKNPSEFSDFPIGQYISVSFFEPELWKSFISPIGLLIYATGIYLAYRYCKPRKI
jgi:uncharacterized protein YlaI